MTDAERLLAQILAELQAMNRHLTRSDTASGGSAKPGTTSKHPIASDADLDGEHGDPEVRFPPKNWPGEDFAGRRLSQTSASFCERMANYWDWQADGDEASADEKKRKSARFKRLDAARARGWEIRLRAAEADAPTGPVPSPDDVGGDDLPF